MAKRRNKTTQPFARRAQPSAALHPARPSAVLRPAAPSAALHPAIPSAALRPARPSAVLRPAQPSAALRPAQPFYFAPQPVLPGPEEQFPDVLPRTAALPPPQAVLPGPAEHYGSLVGSSPDVLAAQNDLARARAAYQQSENAYQSMAGPGALPRLDAGQTRADLLNRMIAAGKAAAPGKVAESMVNAAGTDAFSARPWERLAPAGGAYGPAEARPTPPSLLSTAAPRPSRTYEEARQERLAANPQFAGGAGTTGGYRPLTHEAIGRPGTSSEVVGGELRSLDPSRPTLSRFAPPTGDLGQALLARDQQSLQKLQDQADAEAHRARTGNLLRAGEVGASATEEERRIVANQRGLSPAVRLRLESLKAQGLLPSDFTAMDLANTHGPGGQSQTGISRFAWSQLMKARQTDAGDGIVPSVIGPWQGGQKKATVSDQEMAERRAARPSRLQRIAKARSRLPGVRRAAQQATIDKMRQKIASGESLSPEEILVNFGEKPYAARVAADAQKGAIDPAARSAGVIDALSKNPEVANMPEARGAVEKETARMAGQSPPRTGMGRLPTQAELDEAAATGDAETWLKRYGFSKREYLTAAQQRQMDEADAFMAWQRNPANLLGAILDFPGLLGSGYAQGLLPFQSPVSPARLPTEAERKAMRKKMGLPPQKR